MIADRADHVALLNERHAKKQGEMLPVARLVAGAATVMDSLVVDENWRRYLTLLQGLMERTAAARDKAREKLNDPLVLDHKDMLKLKFDAAEADAMVRAWQIAIELPSLIAKGGEEAREFVKNLEKKNENTSGSANS